MALLHTDNPCLEGINFFFYGHSPWQQTQKTSPWPQTQKSNPWPQTTSRDPRFNSGRVNQSQSVVKQIRSEITFDTQLIENRPLKGSYEFFFFSLACRCANATRAKGWKVFGLQFYGECWSGENGETTFKKYGNASSKKCVQELVDPILPCDKRKDMECVGAQSTNYIYRLKDCKSL